MKILYVIPSFQHPKLRGPTRHYYFIRELSQRHQITLLSLAKSPIAPEVMQEMRSYAEQIYTFNANGASGSFAHQAIGRVPGIGQKVKAYLQHRRGVSQMKKTFRRLARENAFDLVLFHGKPVFRVIDGWAALPMVVDFCDATSLRYLSRMRETGMLAIPALLLRYLRIRQVEKKLLKKTPHLAFISNRDRRAVLGSDSGTRVIPLGIDLEFWKRSSKTPGGNAIIFTGVMDYQPNEDAALFLVEKVLPRVRQSVPDVELILAGRSPSARLLETARRDARITVTGFVDDLRPYLERARVYVAPVSVASGTQNKVVEALAMQIPVVTTHTVSDGLRVERDLDPPVREAESPEEFARETIRLLRTPDACAALVAQGRRYVEDYFDWKGSAAILEDMCRAAAAAGV